MKEGTKVIVTGSHPYHGFEGTIASVSSAEGYVNVRFPQFGRYGYIYEIAVVNLTEVFE